jgi:hypothetical protein
MLAACPSCAAPLPPPPGAVLPPPAAPSRLVVPDPIPPGFAPLGGLALTVMTTVVISVLVTVAGSILMAIMIAQDRNFWPGFLIWATGWGLRVPVFAFFIVWLYRARANLDMLPGARPQWRSEWTALCWIIPLANLVLPGAVISDVARNSVEDYDNAVDRMSRLAWAWWIFIPLPTVLDLVVTIYVPKFVQYPGMAYQLGLAAPGVLATLVSLVLTTRLVGRVTRAQHERVGPIRHFSVRPA